MRLGGRGNPASSDAYAITAATPDAGRNRAISTDATALMCPVSDAAVTVTLKDGQDNGSDRTAAC
ncbi:hypothetical protein KCP77_02300 [Salmonella enterica subsp. enterica]|nr:hypothetical protein KCP77_02300 [Salmonella enterica subsp. enterica]